MSKKNYYNGKGYADPTAYEAIIRADRDALINKRLKGKYKPATDADAERMLGSAEGGGECGKKDKGVL